MSDASCRAAPRHLPLRRIAPHHLLPALSARRPYLDLKSSKAARGGRRVQVYRVRGMPCKEWFDAKDASLAKAPDLEAEVRQSMKLIQAAQPRKRALVQTMPPAAPKQPQRPQRPQIEWASPFEYDGNWMKIHIRVRRG